MVRKLASPPTKLEMGSAMNTPFTPNPKRGSRMVSGTTMMIFRNSEKNTACFAFPRPTKVLCPVNWKAMKKKPKK